MDDIEALRRRTKQARERFRALPASAPDRQGPPDPKSGERWDRYNILGHVAEVLPFWVAQLEIAMDGEPFGRLPGSTERQRAVDQGRDVGETALRERIDSGFEALQRFLDRLESSDLDHKVTMRGRGEETVGWAMENLLVGHAEEHCNQLTELS
ncbi:MAG TPA: DinB family protein [Candidatus Baltobacterales bacterium]|nr:DinB family protein [Candidatus Baltobacterales bacterium]